MEEEDIDTEETEHNDSKVTAHIRGVLSRFAQGDATDYNELVGKLNQSGYLSTDDMPSLLTSLKAVFGMDMWKYGPDVMEVLVYLIIRLATSSGEFVNSSLDMLVNNFMPHESFMEELNEPRGVEKKEQVLDRVHSALIKITNLVPLAPMRLCPILLRRMPDIFVTEPVVAVYVENMLRLESGPIGEFCGSTMILAVVDRLVELDLEVGWDDILPNESNKGIFDTELEEMYDDFDDGFVLVNQANIFAEKLDSLMVVTCRHIRSCAENGRLSKVFNTLFHCFHSSVLNTQRSKFAQFFIFYACSLDPEECGVSFAFMLADIFNCNTEISLTRMSSVAYLASYLARANFLEGHMIAWTLRRLADWCVDYCRLVDAEEKTLDPEAHKLFYSGCQAILYVLCFRMREMLDDPYLESVIFGFPLQLIFCHPLDPLKVCLPSIVEEFLQQAKAASLFTSSEAFGGAAKLDMYFPFDPFLLKKSDRFINPIFLYWSNVGQSKSREGDQSAKFCMFEMVSKGLSRFASLCPGISFGST
ncbi:hypothetical protein MKW98_020204 [Papaver atlanticum]|uniref:RNA polymerase I-specific transcription initiation factor RRN3 n=1 Tax=Papaver atlanticum TaxID=357466 RepID=A0AAD4XA11_9MAGN|nr:hypothetical protein MKW98_020204 [Papaver atlanticum]